MDTIHLLTYGSGYEIRSDITNGDLEVIRRCVMEQYQIMCNTSVDSFCEFRRAFLNSSHKQLSVFERTLPRRSCHSILRQKWVREFCREINFLPLDTYGLGWPALTWRYVAPSSSAEIRGAHRDSWFRLANGEKKLICEHIPLACQTIKVWIALAVETGKSGLLAASGTNKCVFPGEYNIAIVDGIKKPVISMPSLNDGLELLMIKEGQYVIFGENLVHAGAQTKSDTARISLEFTLAPKNYTPLPYTCYS
jgi:hypothetical protein